MLNISNAKISEIEFTTSAKIPCSTKEVVIGQIWKGRLTNRVPLAFVSLSQF